MEHENIININAARIQEEKENKVGKYLKWQSISTLIKYHAGDG